MTRWSQVCLGALVLLAAGAALGEVANFRPDGAMPEALSEALGAYPSADLFADLAGTPMDLAAEADGTGLRDPVFLPGIAGTYGGDYAVAVLNGDAIGFADGNSYDAGGDLVSTVRSDDAAMLFELAFEPDSFGGIDLDGQPYTWGAASPGFAAMPDTGSASPIEFLP